ncbi:MAG: insulinase family protein [Treponema sp.]|nr:insulinase family protein [Treponema sp.]
MKIYKLIAVLLAVFFILTCVSKPAIDPSLQAELEKVPLVNDAITGILPNGLRYYILENSFPQNRAHLALVVNAGSVLERNNERGFAHFVEHMAFKGTTRFPEMELIDYLRSLGMRFGPDANAYTSYNETVYHFDVPVENVNGIKQIPHRALAILDDWTHAVSFNPDDVHNESLVVLEEIRARSGAMDRVRKILFPILFKGSPYENRDVIGLANIIENATPQQLRAFYDRWYTSDNMVLVFVGDFDGKALEAELTQHFNMPSARRPVNRPVYNLPPPRNNNFHVEIITDPELTAVSYNIYYKQKQGFPRGTVGYFREKIIHILIDQMLSMRFAEASEDPQAAASGSWSSIWQWVNSQFFVLGTQPKTGNAEQALIELLLEKESIRRFGFTQSELQRAKLNLVSSLERTLSEKDRRESRSFLNRFVNHYLFGEDFADIEWELNMVNTLLPFIDLEEITQTVRNYFLPNDINVFLIAPEAEANTLPSENRIRAIFRETQNAQIQPRQDEIFSGELLDKLPVPGRIISETTDAQTGAVTLRLSNGAEVIYKETTNRNNEIIFYAMSRGGYANATEENIVSVRILPDMLNASGLGNYSRTELINKLAGKQVSFSFWSSDYYRGFQGSSTTQDFNTLFEMLNIFFTNPRLDERAITAMLDQYRTSLIHQMENPQNVFSREIQNIVSNNHPFFKSLELSDIDRVSIRQAGDFLNNYINPADYTFIFTGNINPDIIREFSALYIASIPAARSMNNWVNPGVSHPIPGRRTIYKGLDERSIVYLGWFVPETEGFNEQKNQVSDVLSEYLRILLSDEIRENLSGVYSISAGSSISVIPIGTKVINAYFMCGPNRAEELISAVRENIMDIFRQPINIETFNMAKEALLMGHERSMQQNLHIARSFANSSVLYNTTLNRLNLRPEAIRAVTPQEVQALCREILAVNPVELILFPEGWND